MVPDYDAMWANAYGDHQVDGPVHRHLRRIVPQLLANLRYESVLDVGCGIGGNFPLLCEGRHVKRMTGIDISAAALERAAQIHAGDFHLVDIQHERLAGTWDLVHCSLVLEHLPDDRAALGNMRAMTGRHLLVVAIAGDFKRYRAWDEAVGHVRNYDRGELEEKLARAGFRVTRTIYWGFPFYSPFARTLQNYCREGIGRFRPRTRLLARMFYLLYFLNLSHWGDLLIVKAEV